MKAQSQPGSDPRYDFSEHELVNLTMPVVAINRWNSPGISFHWPAGGYQPQRSNLT